MSTGSAPDDARKRIAPKQYVSSLFNWLENLDRIAKDFPPADDWDEQPAFVFARYPRLKPRHVPRSDHKEFSQILAKWHTRISKDPRTSCAITDLSRQNQTQLAALVLDTILALRKLRSLRSRNEYVSMVRAAGPRQERMLNRKFVAVIDALEDLDNYSMKLEDPSLGEPTRDVVKQCLDLLRFNIPLPFRSLVLSDNGVNSPLDENMAQLYWFFRRGCKLPGHEAEVRVALIRNTFWTEYGVRRVSYRAKYENTQLKGCPAVHQAIRRFSKAQGTIQ